MSPEAQFTSAGISGGSRLSKGGRAADKALAWAAQGTWPRDDPPGRSRVRRLIGLRHRLRIVRDDKFLHNLLSGVRKAPAEKRAKSFYGLFEEVRVK